jgi:hypothetical protein
VIPPRPVFVGAVAALVAPWHLEGRRLKRLLAPVDGRPDASDAHAAARWARRGIRILSRLPFSPWRDTCLYRAVAACLAIRWIGGDAIVRIGTRRDPETGEVVAHAWIDGTPDEPAADAGYRVLEARVDR